MWPDDHSSWQCSPRHSYLRSCENKRLLPHPRLLQFTNNALLPPKSLSSAGGPLGQNASQNVFVAAFGFVAEQTFLGDAGLEACIPLIQAVLTSGGERGKQLRLDNVGITHVGFRSLGNHLQTWSLSAASKMQVADVDFSNNVMNGAPSHVSSVSCLQPILGTPHIRRLVLSGCK
jgi:hypothetical protein